MSSGKGANSVEEASEPNRNWPRIIIWFMAKTRDKRPESVQARSTYGLLYPPQLTKAGEVRVCVKCEVQV